MGPYKINNTKEVQSKAQNMDDSVITPMTPLTPQNNSPVPVN